MKSILVRLGLTTLIVGSLAGCGGGSTSSVNVAPTTGFLGAGPVQTAAEFQALRPQIDPASISVSITPQSGVYPNLTGGTVIKYKVTDQFGKPIIGLGGQSNNPAQTNVTKVPTNYDISFTLAKLIPAVKSSSGVQLEPSRWVNYFVTKLASTSTAASAVTVSNGVAYSYQYPSADSNGTMVDNGDGTYQYTFLRDPTKAQAIIKALPATLTVGSTTYNTADLDPEGLAYDANATTRLGILLTGSQPGTGTAVPGGVQGSAPNPVPLVYTLSQAYDFIPATGKAAVPGTDASREIVMAGSCDSCHDNVSQKRGIGHVSSATNANGIPPGAYVGRNDPRLCVACHTDQTKFGFDVVTSGTNTDGSPKVSGAYFRVDPTTVPTTGFNQAAFTYPRMIHQTHMGDALIKTGYNLNGHAKDCSSASAAGTAAAQCLNLVGLPQDQRNCTKCHDGNATKSDGSTNVNKSADGNNWKLPSIMACGACHDGINFMDGSGITLADKDADVAAKKAVGTTKSGHKGGAQSDNKVCIACHVTGGTGGDVVIAHATPYDTLNSVALQAGVDKVAYSISKVTVNASGQPVITFAIKVNGTAINAMNPVTTYVSATGVVTANPSIAPFPQFPELTNVGGLSLYVGYAVPQDGIANPADFNVSASASLANLLVASGSPKAGSIVNNNDGTFTATLTGNLTGQVVDSVCKQQTTIAGNGMCVNPSPIIVPGNASMVTGVLLGGLTQNNLPAYAYKAYQIMPIAASNVAASGGLTVYNTLAKVAASTCSQAGATSACTTARRVITATALCNNCHDRLGTNPNFHSGYRNDPTACNICHNANRTDNGWPVNSSTWFHGIHGASKRVSKFTPVADYSAVLYPGQLKDCNQCHLPNTVNYGATGGGLPGSSASNALFNNLLWSYTATGTPSKTTTVAPSVPVPNQTTYTVLTVSPYVVPGQNYGNAFTFANASAVLGSVTSAAGVASSAVVVTNPLGMSVPADAAALVNTPISSACFSCHDDSTAANHMKTNGGILQGVRGAAAKLNNTEACLACHGQGTTMDAAVIHQLQ
jgi:OmcA/MtrC family decaheme c-type cytochrome